MFEAHATNRRRLAREAALFLARRPVDHNLVATLLAASRAGPDQGSYWHVSDLTRGAIRGVAVQTDPHRALNLTPMAVTAAGVLGRYVATRRVRLPGVIGEAATCRAFADAYAATKGVTVRPDGTRLLYLQRARAARAPRCPGDLVVARSGDHKTVLDLMTGFYRDIGESAVGLDVVVADRLARGLYRLWVDEHARTLVGHSVPINRAARIQVVYTRPSDRRRGYGFAAVHRLSAELQESGLSRLLFADAANETSNPLFRRAGYKLRAEIAELRFV